MADMTITVKIEDLPEFKARLARIKKIMRRRAWVNGHRTGKARNLTWDLWTDLQVTEPWT